MAPTRISVVRVEEKSKAHLIHWLSDGRYVLENRHARAQARWSLWEPRVGPAAGGTFQREGSSLGQLLKWAARHPYTPRSAG
jgi:hypothetical protein